MLSLLWALVMGLVFVAAGVAMLISPQRFRIFLDRLARLDQWTTLKPSFSPRDETSTRIAGIGIATFGLVFFYYTVTALLGHGSHRVAQPSPVQEVGVSWSAFLLSLMVAAMGAVFLVRPSIIEWWAARTMPHRDLSHSKAGGKVLLFFRLLGATLLFLSIMQILNQFRRL